jgi:hypothetical protein
MTGKRNSTAFRKSPFRRGNPAAEICIEESQKAP